MCCALSRRNRSISSFVPWLCIILRFLTRSIRCGEFRGFARRGVVVADLVRSDFGIVGIYLLTGFLVRHPMNKFDGRLSIRHAFSFRELAAAAAEAGWSRFGHRGFPVNRQAIWLEGEALT